MTQKILVLPDDGIGLEIIATVKMALHDTLDAILEYVNSRTVDARGGLSTKALG